MLLMSKLLLESLANSKLTSTQRNKRSINVRVQYMADGPWHSIFCNLPVHAVSIASAQSNQSLPRPHEHSLATCIHKRLAKIWSGFVDAQLDLSPCCAHDLMCRKSCASAQIIHQHNFSHLFMTTDTQLSVFHL